MTLIINEVKLLEEEYNGDAPLSALKRNMEENHGVTEDKVDALVKNLIQKGILYTPSHGYVKRV